VVNGLDHLTTLGETCTFTRIEGNDFSFSTGMILHAELRIHVTISGERKALLT
jgi:hypothetical protein